MREYSFAVSGPLNGGRVIIRVVNAGHETHSPILVALDDASPPIDQVVRQPSPPSLAQLGSVNSRFPGAAGEFAVDLERGHRYAFVCRATTAEGEGHAQKGMTWEARAGEYPVTRH